MQEHSLFNSPRLLIIEDDKDTRYMLEVLMELKGYQTIAVADFENVPTLIGNRIPDLIIVNISRPVDEGLQMLRQVHEYFLQVPIIVTSTCAVPGFRTEAFRAGSNAVFIKPLDFGELDSIIEQNLPHTYSSQ